MGVPVTLNVYDLHDNSWIYWCGIGEGRSLGMSNLTVVKLILSKCLSFALPWLCKAKGRRQFASGENAGIFHSGVEVYNVEYAYGGAVHFAWPLWV
jgi:hypothetical protein